MAFTANDVKNLREMTGVGMLDCKKALTETDGDTDKAIEWLREKGLAAAQKKAGRIAAEGMAYAAVEDGIGVVVEVNAETDFVSQNELFVSFAKGVAAVVAKANPADLDALLDAAYPETGRTVREEQQEKVLVIGENIQVRRFARYEGGVTVPYNHMGGRIGVLVNLAVSAGLEANGAVFALGKDIAMQIAAMNPLYLDKGDVDSSTLDKEREILMAQAKEENDASAKPKPENILAKMVEGRVSKYYEENCLLQQAFVKENKVSVEQHVAAVAKELGGTIAVQRFVRFEKGEGIEKKQENFAEEIAKQLQR
jgi:elongation factor Ts